MTLKEVQDILEAELVCGKPDCRECESHEVLSGRASDLMSDLLTFQGPKPVLLTGLTNAQVIRTSEILDIVGICFVRGKTPPSDTMALAQEKDIPLFVTKLSMYEACGRLFAKGLPAGAKRR